MAFEKSSGCMARIRIGLVILYATINHATINYITQSSSAWEHQLAVCTACIEGVEKATRSDIKA
jgi:hypothetical protein